MILPSKKEVLHTLLTKASEAGAAPGMSYALVTKTEYILDYLGNRRLLPSPQPVTGDTLYDLASLTKVVATTTAILQLMESGEFCLSTPVSRILPQYQNPTVTIKHLLTHTSGHAADINCLNMTDRRELVDAIYADRIKEENFDRKVIYSDIGYIILGFVIEHVTGSLETYVTDHILKPLEMTHTFYNPPAKQMELCAATEYDKQSGRIIQGVVHDEKCRLLGGITGHAGLFSTSLDMVKFMQMLLNRGILNDQMILNPSTVQVLFQNHTKGMGTNRGLGWIHPYSENDICDFISDESLYHTGFTGTSALADIKAGKGFILLTNRVHPSRENTGLVTLRHTFNNAAVSAII
ncbi:serine hydrolase domain-containing protein [Anaerocolumna sp. MB42-C2]|uniref:serine hydrolase domain-containing protein n=1 Tax=Anaerocolumna sp. MB42-C2 TaxID=3070997 RepID=UPI0027DF9CD6|nr:serine hydrolase domain-containing protein [Anaerocolumna sp. MB42-C2]WMJ87837.1 serine hydrolase domain-containing protein [Anaerocolumna sp. MB42-C2]